MEWSCRLSGDVFPNPTYQPRTICIVILSDTWIATTTYETVVSHFIVRILYGKDSDERWSATKVMSQQPVLSYSLLFFDSTLCMRRR